MSKAVMGAMLALATACVPTSPAVGGVTGLAVNADGQLVMMASWCGTAPDGVVIYRHEAGELLDQAKLKTSTLSAGITSVNLDEPPAIWKVAEGNLKFEKGRTYTVRAYSSTANATFLGVDFTLDTKRAIPSGRIVIQEHGTSDSRDVMLSEAEFSARAKHLC